MMDKALKKVDEVEIYKVESDGLLFKTVLDRVESLDSHSGKGYSLRIIKNGRLGFSYFIKEDQFPKALTNAIKISKFKEKLDISFPLKKRYPKVKGLNSNSLTKKEDEEFNDVIIGMIDEFKGNSVRHIQSMLSYTNTRQELINSNGGKFSSDDSLMSISCIGQMGKARDFETKTSRNFFDGIDIARNTMERTRFMRRARHISGEFRFILEPRVVSSLIEYFLLSDIEGDSILKKKSILTDKLGKKIAPDNITLIEAPLINSGNASSSSDDEGIPCKEKKIIDNGYLKQFVYNLETAAKAKKKTTSNGFRVSFNVGPLIDTTNIVVKAKNYVDMKDVSGIQISEVMGIHNSNSSTGDFSLNVTNAALVKKGKKIRPIGSTEWVGNFYTILNELELGNDKQVYGSYYGPSWVYNGKLY